LALIGRILVVLFAYVVACLAAAAMLFVCWEVYRSGWEETSRILSAAPQHRLAMAIGAVAMVVAGFVLIPAAVVIVVAEGFHLRSIVFYGGCGGAIGLAVVGWIAVARGPGGHVPPADVVAAAGIVAGFVYWAIAGGAAGAWRATPSVGAGKQ
jgi:hypothetical protein